MPAQLITFRLEMYDNRMCLDLDITELTLQHQDVFNSTNAAMKNMKLSYLAMPLNINKYVYLYLMQALARMQSRIRVMLGG